MKESKLFKRAPEEAAVGSSLVGYVGTSYFNLLNAFGNPPYGPTVDNKVDVVWVFELPSGIIFSLYNFKNGPAYLGPGVLIANITEWSINALMSADVPRIFEFLKAQGFIPTRS